MCDSIELKTIGKSPQEIQSRINTSRVTISLRTIIIIVAIFTVIFATLLSTSIYIIHNDKVSKTDLRQFQDHVSALHLTQLVNNLQQEYLDKMNQNISRSLFLETNPMLELHNATKNHCLKTYDDTEKPFIEVDAETVSTYRNQLSDKIDQSFVTLNNEQTFRRVASEYSILGNETTEQTKKLYDEEFQAAVTNYKGRDPPEVSPEFHKHVTELTLEKVYKFVPPSPKVFSELRADLNAKYNKTLQDHVFIGIDLGERFITSIVYANGQLQQSAKFRSYVGLEEYDDNQDNLPYAVSQSENPLPIFYDLKEIVRAWNSFNTSSDKLFWTFNIQQGTHGGPTVFSPNTGIHHPVESVLAKLFQRVKNATRKSFYNDTTRCVITIPYDFTEDQRNLILEAGNAAGFQEVTLLDEDISTALTLQYVNGPWSVTKTIMFLEFNQLSWKIYILQGHQSNFTRIVSATYNETQDVVNFCIKNCCEQGKRDKNTFQYDGSIEARIRWRRFYDECESDIFFPNRHLIVGRCLSFKMSLNVYLCRHQAEEDFKKQVEHFTHFIDFTLRQVKLTKEKIDGIIMGGKYGNVRIIKERMSWYFPGRNVTINGIPPSYTAAYGAGVKGLELAAAAIKQSRRNSDIV